MNLGGGEPRGVFGEECPPRICTMRANRKRQSLHIGAIAKWLGVCALIMALGLAYTWKKDHLYRLGEELKHKEAAAADAKKRIGVLEGQLAQAQSPAALELKVQQLRLGLVPPREAQVVRLTEPAPEFDATFASPQLARNTVTKISAQRQ
jgi:hypothetical protein